MLELAHPWATYISRDAETHIRRVRLTWRSSRGGRVSWALPPAAQLQLSCIDLRRQAAAAVLQRVEQLVVLHPPARSAEACPSEPAATRCRQHPKQPKPASKQSDSIQAARQASKQQGSIQAARQHPEPSMVYACRPLCTLMFAA